MVLRTLARNLDVYFIAWVSYLMAIEMRRNQCLTRPSQIVHTYTHTLKPIVPHKSLVCHSETVVWRTLVRNLAVFGWLYVSNTWLWSNSDRLDSERAQSRKHWNACVETVGFYTYLKSTYSRTSLNRTPRDRPKLFGLTNFRFIRFIYKEHIETGISETVRFKR